MMYAEYSSLIDTALVTALAVIVWAVYRDLRKRRQNSNQTPQLN